MKHIACGILTLLLMLAGAACAGESADTTVTKSALMKQLADSHEQLSKQFQYSLTAEQLALQEKMKAALIQYQTLNAIRQDTLRVGK